MNGGAYILRTMKRKIRCGGAAMTAIVLAGGRGLRMKADKAGLPVGGRTLLEHVIGQIEPYFEDILVSISPRQKIAPPGAPRNIVSVSPGQKVRRPSGPEGGAGRCKNRGLSRESLAFRVVEDETPGLGPLGGILAGLRAAENGACAVVACDIPEINIPLLRSLARAAQDAEIAVPIGPAGLFEPLFAVYRKSVVPEIEALLRAGERSILPLFGRCRTVAVRLEDAGWLLNLNTREDYRDYLKSLGRASQR